MKKIIVLTLVFCLTLGMLACGQASGGGNMAETNAAPAGEFKAGFGMVDITPTGTVTMNCYGDGRQSTGLYTYLEARAVAIQDASGQIMIFAVGDISTAPKEFGDKIIAKIRSSLDIPEENIILSGTHTHASVEHTAMDNPDNVKFFSKYVDGMAKAALDAVADLKPAKIYVGSAYTNNLNFNKRYIMDDGSLLADNYPGTGTTIVRHENDPDNEMQLLKFVREGGEDILIAQYQAHPHLEGLGTLISSQGVGTFRDAAEADMDIHVLAWNGAAGNLNNKSRIASEMRTTDPREWGKLLWQDTKVAYDDMTEVEPGLIQVAKTTVTGKVNHEYDSLLSYAEMVRDYYKSGHSMEETTAYGMQWGIHSFQHASRIKANFNLPETQQIELVAWNFGEIAGVVIAFEMYDSTGIYIKEESPFQKTFIVGYSYPSYGGYIPDQEAFAVGGYEVDNCTYVSGTAEMLEEAYLGLLKDLHK